MRNFKVISVDKEAYTAEILIDKSKFTLEFWLDEVGYTKANSDRKIMELDAESYAYNDYAEISFSWNSKNWQILEDAVSKEFPEYDFR